MRGTWRFIWRFVPPPRPPWQRALGMVLLVGAILLVVYKAEVMDQVKHLLLTSEELATLGGLVAGGAVLVAAVNWRVRQWRQRRRRYEQELSARTAEAVGQQIGAQPELLEMLAKAWAEGSDLTFERPWSSVEQAQIDQEVAGQVDLATHALIEAQRAQAERLEQRVRAIEEKFPDAAQFQKFAHANELFLTYQIGEVVKRIERIEDKLLSRTQVVGIVIATIVTTIAVIGGLFAILRAVGLLH